MTGKITPNFIEVRQGDNFTILLQFKDEKKGGLINLTNAALKMQVRNKEDNKVVLTKTGSIDDAIKGKASISILPEDTKNLSFNREYITDIQITFGNGEVHTIYPSEVSKVAAFIVSQNVTE